MRSLATLKFLAREDTYKDHRDGYVQGAPAVAAFISLSLLCQPPGV